MSDAHGLDIATYRMLYPGDPAVKKVSVECAICDEHVAHDEGKLSVHFLKRHSGVTLREYYEIFVAAADKVEEITEAAKADDPFMRRKERAVKRKPTVTGCLKQPNVRMELKPSNAEVVRDFVDGRDEAVVDVGLASDTEIRVDNALEDNNSNPDSEAELQPGWEEEYISVSSSGGPDDNSNVDSSAYKKSFLETARMQFTEAIKAASNDDSDEVSIVGESAPKVIPSRDKYKCSECGFEAADSSDIIAHIIRTDERNAKVVPVRPQWTVCELCEGRRAFGSEFSMVLHARRVHAMSLAEYEQAVMSRNGGDAGGRRSLLKPKPMRPVRKGRSKTNIIEVGDLIGDSKAADKDPLACDDA